MAAMSDRVKTDWIFDLFDVNRNGSLEIKEVISPARANVMDSPARSSNTCPASSTTCLLDMHPLASVLVLNLSAVSPQQGYNPQLLPGRDQLMIALSCVRWKVEKSVI